MMVFAIRTNTRYTSAVSLALLMTFALAGCGGGSSKSCASTPCTVTVSWNANPEAAVNTTGGGYNVYYSTTPNFSVGGAGVTKINVPYASGSSAPTTVTLPTGLYTGTYYFRVEAYSALNPPGGTTGSTSAPSAQQVLQVP